MKPSKDPFEQHIQGLYEGLEVPTTASTKAAVFNALDKSIATASIASKVSKPVLAAATVILAVTWYVMPGDVPVESQAPSEAVPVLVEEQINETVDVVADEYPEVSEVESPVVELASEPADALQEAIEQPEVVEEVIADPVVDQVPVEIQAEQPTSEKTDEKADEKPDAPSTNEEEKSTKWVLPATLQVEE